MSDTQDTEKTSETPNNASGDDARVELANEGDVETGDAVAEPAMTLDELIAVDLVHPLVLDALRDAREAARNAEEARLRALAEVANQRKQFQKEQERRLRYANESLLLDLLPVLDNLELCLSHSEGAVNPEELREGVSLTAEQFRQGLKGLGVEEVEAAPGGVFEPKRHDAIARDEETSLPAGTIVNAARSGFTYRDRLLRPAQVVVAAGRAVENDEEPEKSNRDAREETSEKQKEAKCFGT